MLLIDIKFICLLWEPLFMQIVTKNKLATLSGPLEGWRFIICDLMSQNTPICSASKKKPNIFFTGKYKTPMSLVSLPCQDFMVCWDTFYGFSGVSWQQLTPKISNFSRVHSLPEKVPWRPYYIKYIKGEKEKFAKQKCFGPFFRPENGTWQNESFAAIFLPNLSPPKLL